MRDGSLHTDGARPVIRFERHLTRPPAEVWRALVDRDGLRHWFPSDIVTEEWKPGATLQFPFRAAEGPTLTGTVLEYDEPRTLAYTWGEETLRFELTPEAGGTRLVFTHELDGPTAARTAAGWDVCLDMLAGDTPGRDAWKPRFEHYTARFEPELGPQEGPPGAAS